MPLWIPAVITFLAKVAGTIGIVKGGIGVARIMYAKKLVDQANTITRNATNSLEYQREITNFDLKELGQERYRAYNEEMRLFVQVFSHIKKVKVNKNALVLTELGKKRQLVTQTYHTYTPIGEYLSITATVGVAVGIASGPLAYITAGAVGFASTGTPIAVLHGIAATNATLAWFGGGAKAAGGMGMAVGVKVLGGLMLGTGIGLAGFVFDENAKNSQAQAEEDLQHANFYVSKVDSAVKLMKSISNHSKSTNQLLISFTSYMRPRLQYYLPRVLERPVRLNRFELWKDELRKYVENHYNKTLESYNKLSMLKSVTEKELQRVNRRLNLLAWLIWQLQYKKPFYSFTNIEQDEIMALVTTAQAVKELINAPIVTNDGTLHQNICQLLKKIQIVQKSLPTNNQ